MGRFVIEGRLALAGRVIVVCVGSGGLAIGEEM